MGGRLLMFAAVVLLAGCGVKSQQTPEPSETERVDALVERLGVERTYDSRTLLMNPEPDGRILMAWMDRRKATLAGKLPLTDLPALTNPGSVQATLAWELETEKAEAGNSNTLTHYMLDFEHRKGACPRSSGAEEQWYTREQDAHARGLRRKLINWPATNAGFQARCDIEANAYAARADAAKRATAEARTQLVQGERECRTLSEVADQAYQDAPSIETGHALDDAQQRVSKCLGGFDQQRRIVDEADSRL